MFLRQAVAQRLKEYLLGSQENQSDPLVLCKLFQIDGSGTWYITEYDQLDTVFCYVTGLGGDEWGYASLAELEALCLMDRIPRIECDLHFASTAFSQLKLC